MGLRDEKKAFIRHAITEAAGRKMRSVGFDGIGVDGLAEEAGFTSGAFYSQFDSKHELLIEVVRRGFDSIVEDTQERVEKDGNEWYEKRHRHYLSMRHRDSVEEGCLLPNLSVDAARGGDDVQKTYEAGLEQLIDVFSAGLQASEAKDPRERAIAAISLMAGGILLARGVKTRKAAEEILEACRGFLP